MSKATLLDSVENFCPNKNTFVKFATNLNGFQDF